MSQTTELGDPIGAPVPGWAAPALPPRATIEGQYVRLEPQTLSAHGDDLWDAFSAETSGADWTHRFIGPFQDRAAFDAQILADEHNPAQLYFAYVDKTSGKALGNGAFMSMAPAAGSIEVGSIMFSRAMQRTRAATEAIFLHMKWAFEAGYRRFEWTCDPLNAASMGAAERFGFTFEAVFRQAYVAKGRNRDKACFSVIDRDWPDLRTAFTAWFDPANFDADGRQRQSLRALTAPFVSARTDPAISPFTNDLGQPVDRPVAAWKAPPRPTRMVLAGDYCRLEPLTMEHAARLFTAHKQDADGRNWTYLPDGPFADLPAYEAWVWDAAASPDPMHYTIITEDGPVGTASLMRIAPGAGSIEVGYITYSPLLQRTRASTEAMHLMMRWAFQAGYRRYEWKCNALNAPSRRAAERLGFRYEGIFRQAQVTKGGNRDTAWYGMTDGDWPAIDSALSAWLAPQNFDAEGRQLRRLEDLRPVD